MVRKFIPAICLSLLISTVLFAQIEEPVTLNTDTGNIEGTLLIPDTTVISPVALIIAGSGPTDRNGNNPAMTNNCLLMLADSLAQHGIASLRYDKRGIAKSQSAGLDESQLRFEDYIQDAVGWIAYLRSDSRFGDIIVIGHSEGSLIGMIASQQGAADKFISLAGIAQTADNIIREQLQTQAPAILAVANPILDSLAQGKTVSDVPSTLYSLFRPSVQPYMISWMKYDPTVEIAKLKIPVLIIQGTTDIQVKVKEAQALAKANPEAQIRIIDGMNHILKPAVADPQTNFKTYTDPNLPLMPEMVKSIVHFIK